jgi:hypothetical protein
MQPSLKTIKRLCTLSGNRCAFYGCTVPLVDDASDVVLGEICHIRAAKSGGPRFDVDQPEEDRHSFANLILLCSTHHTLVDSAPEKYTVEYLQQIKTANTASANFEVRQLDSRRAERLLRKHDIQVNGPLTINSVQASNVVIKSATRARPRVTLPADVIGGSSNHRRYIAHLVKRYHDFASEQSGRTFKHAVIYKRIEAKFGTTWEWISLVRFHDLVTFIQEKIDDTLIGKRNRSKGVPNYSHFGEYSAKYETGRTVTSQDDT